LIVGGYEFCDSWPSLSLITLAVMDRNSHLWYPIQMFSESDRPLIGRRRNRTERCFLPQFAINDLCMPHLSPSLWIWMCESSSHMDTYGHFTLFESSMWGNIRRCRDSLVASDCLSFPQSYPKSRWYF
jgi:hypothetical protein